jgi:hypothetical protein
VQTYFGESDDDESKGLDGSVADQTEDDEEMSGSGAAAPPAAFATSISKRCGGFMDKCIKRGRLFVEKYSKLKWAEQTAAHAKRRAVQSAESENSEDEDTEGAAGSVGMGPGSGKAATTTAAPAADGSGVTNSAECLAEGVPAATTTAAENRPWRTKLPLVEAQCLMAFVRPDGRVDCIASEGIRKHSLTGDMRQYLQASLELMVREQQLRASVGQRVMRRAKQLASSKSTHALEDKQVAPSTKLRAAAREAYQQHVAPTLLDLDVCAPANWRQCIVKDGRGVCKAGGKCKEARAVLGWPDDLACVDPNRVDPDGEWKKPFLQFLIDKGHDVEIPTTASPAGCFSSFTVAVAHLSTFSAALTSESVSHEQMQ